MIRKCNICKDYYKLYKLEQKGHYNEAPSNGLISSSVNRSAFDKSEMFMCEHNIY